MAGRGREAWQAGPGGAPGGPGHQQGFPGQGGWPGPPNQQARPQWGAPQQGSYPGMQRPPFGGPQGPGPQQFPGPPRPAMPHMGQPQHQGGFHPMQAPGGPRPAGGMSAGGLPQPPVIGGPVQMQQPYGMAQQQMQVRGPPQQALPQAQANPNPMQRSPAVQQNTPQAKGGWTEHQAPTGRKYYYHAATKISSWSKPPEFTDQVKPEGVPPEAKPAEVQCDWKEFSAPNGRKYYYNRVTKTSVWQIPEELKAAQALAAGNKVKSEPSSVQVLKLASPGQPSPAATPAINGSAPTPEARWKAEQAAAVVLPEPKKPIIYATKEEAKDAFKELLASVGTASNATWEATMRLIVNDPRYEAFKTIGEKKACFNEYLQQRAKEEKEESRTKAKQTREAFFTLLELSPELKTGMRYSKAATLFDDEPRWKAIKEPREREQLFNEHMKERERKEKETRRAELKKKKSAFKHLLEANKSIRVDSVWRKVQSKLEGEDEYENLDKYDRLEVFQDHIRDLEKKEKERRDKEKEQKLRLERHNRDAFKELLKSYKERGSIVPKMRWKDFHALIEEEEALKALERNAGGARPKELFEDVLEDIEEVYVQNRSVLRDAKFEFQIDMPYSDFAASIETTGEKAAEVPDAFRKLYFEEEIGKLKERAAKEERRRRKLREDFYNLLRDTRKVKHDTTWADAKIMLEKEPEYKAMESKDKEEIFNEYVEKLKERREKDKEREREREEKRAKKADEEEKPRKDKKHHKKDRHGDKERSSHKKSKDKDKDKERQQSKRRHDESEEDEEKRSSKKHRRDKDKAKSKDRLEGSPAQSASEPEGQPQEQPPQEEKPLKEGHGHSDSEEGQL